MPRRHWPRWGRLLISLAVTALLIVPLSYILRPHAVRWQMLHNTTSDDLAKRERALNFALRRAQDPAVIRALVQRLDVDDDANFVQLINVLDLAGQWQRPTIPMTGWMRWLSLLAHETDPKARMLAAQHLADLPDHADNLTLLSLLEQLSGDDNADVRYNAIVAAAELAGRAAPSPRLLAMLSHATTDDVEEIARQAWLFLGVVGEAAQPPTEQQTVETLDRSPRVAEAMFWTVARNWPQHTDRLIRTLADTTADIDDRIATLHGLALLSAQPGTRNALLRVLCEFPPDLIDEQNQLLVWRSVLAVDHFHPLHSDARAVLHDWAHRCIESHSPIDPLYAPILLAITHRLGAPMFSIVGEMSEQETLMSRLAELAALEGLGRSSVEVRVDEGAPELLRAMAAWVSISPRVEDLRPALGSEQATLRDLSVFIAADRLERDQLEALGMSLIVDYNDDAKMSGAILSGLTEQNGELLQKRTLEEDQWTVQQVMRLGLWMQGAQPEMAQAVTGLLTRDDLPFTTILLAMLHHQDERALEFLLNPRGEPRSDIMQTLIVQRWWHVLSRFLPRDAPRLWFWADDGLQEFQLDALRNWYLLRRGSVWRPIEAR